MISRRIVINVIAFLVLSTLLIAALIVNIFRVQPRYTVWAEFENTGGAFTGQEVTYRGVNVGRIGHMRVTREGVEVELVIERTFDRIPQDTGARIMFKSAVGEQFIDIVPETVEPPFLDDGDRIPIERTTVPIQQETLLRQLAAVLDGVPPEAMGNLVDTLGRGLGGRGQDLHLALSSLDPVTDVLARRTAELNRIAIGGDRVGAAFSRTSEEFVAAARHMATVAESLGRSTPDIERLLQHGAVGIPELAGLVAVRKAEIDRTLANLAEVTRLNFEHLASVEDTLEWLPLFLEVIIQMYDPQINRLRFGLTSTEGNPPCPYGTPRRLPTDRSGNAEYQPITEYECAAPAGPVSASVAEPGVGTASEVALGSWTRLVADTLRVP